MSEHKGRLRAIVEDEHATTTTTTYPLARAGPARADPPARASHWVSLRAYGYTKSIRIWRDQENWLRDNQVELGPLVRGLIDSLQGFESTLGRLNRTETALRARVLARVGADIVSRSKTQALRARELENARVSALAKLQIVFRSSSRPNLPWEQNVAWVRARTSRIPALRNERPESVLDYLLELPLEGA